MSEDVSRDLKNQNSAELLTTLQIWEQSNLCLQRSAVQFQTSLINTRRALHMYLDSHCMWIGLGQTKVKQRSI